MNLSRHRLLREMGVSPTWALRDKPGSPPVNPPDAPSSISFAENDEKRQSPAASTRTPPPLVSPPEERPTADACCEIPRMDWTALRQQIMACRACGLCAKRKQAVPGVGDENAAWLFIGEGPGAEEDARGEPFVGPAGQLLDAMLAAIDLRRGQDVYIANAVKCRPPANRNPESAEMAACFPYLERQIELIAPKLIVLLGRVALQAVLGIDSSLSGARGKRLRYAGSGFEIPVVATYHPAYLLRQPADKAKAWEDLNFARDLMNTLRSPCPNP